jgi:signal transduction histidine kinase
MAFVRAYLKTGSLWPIATVAVLWGIVVLQSMVLPDGVVHTQITALVPKQTPWGETFYVASGPVNPGKYVADVAVLIMLFSLGKAVLEAPKRGRRGRALWVAGSGALFLLIAVTMVNLQDSGILAVPLVIPSAFLIVVTALTHNIISQIFAARRAAGEIARLRRALTLGEMVGGITHEINQPLAAILSNAQAARRFLAKSDVDLDEIRDIVDDIIIDEKRASNIIRGFRNMLQRKTQTDSTADIAASVRNACGLVKGEFSTSDVALVIDLQPDHRPVLVDPIELEQVLVNLLLNAARAAAKVHARDRRVEIRCREDGQTAEFAVMDRGPGIDTETSDRLFEPFVSNSENGLGMGLTVCRRIVERYGGHIWSETREGGGAVFRFTLPLTESGAGS